MEKVERGRDNMNERMRQSRRRWLLSLPILISVGVVGFVGVNKTESDKKGDENVLTLIESDLGLKKPLQFESSFSESKTDPEDNHRKVEVEVDKSVDKDVSSPPMNTDHKPPVEDDSVGEGLPQPPVMEKENENEGENENEDENETDDEIEDGEEGPEEIIQKIVPPQIEIEEIGKQLKVTITHELLTGSEEEELQYRINYQEWETYEAPFYLPIDDYVIESQLIMGEKVSKLAKEDVLPKLPTLEAPRIEVTAEKYRAEVSLSHPRFEGLPEEVIEYRIEDQEWQPYEKPFDWLPEWQSLEVRYREGSRVSEMKRETVAFEHPICERGNATKESPCVITTPEQLNALQVYVNEERMDTTGQYYELGNDIDFDGYDNDDNPDNGSWTPIGDLGLGFSGTFDGKFFSIKNIIVNQPDLLRTGFFGRVIDAQVRNLNLVNIEVKGNHFVGGVAGVAAKGSVIEDIKVTGSLKGLSDLGGVVGYLHGSYLKNSYTEVETQGLNRVGGLVGYNIESSEITNSYTKNGNIRGADYVGGAIGMNSSNSLFSNIYSINKVYADLKQGGLVGGDFSVVANKGYWDTFVSQDFQSVYGVGLATEQMTGFNALKYMEGFDFEKTWQLCQGDYPQLKIFTTCTPLQTGYAGGIGTEEDPYLISSEQQLDWLRFEVNELKVSTRNKFYKLVNDLNFKDYESNAVKDDGNFEPIGLNNNPFMGDFNGEGNTVSFLKIFRPGESNVGMFGKTEKGAVIRNISLKDVSIFGGRHVGALIGWSKDSLVVNGRVFGSVSGDGSAIGGVIGYTSNNSLTKDSYANIEMQGFGDSYGGLIGYNGSQIQNSYSEGAIDANNNVGGLVGINDGVVINSYTKVSVDAVKHVGGLIGWNRGEVSQAYASGSLNGQSVVGGLIGYKQSGDSTESYWNKEVSGYNTTPDTAIGLITSQMTGFNALKYMEGFDFENTWQLCQGDYPQLKAFATCIPLQTGYAGGSGTEDDPYLISSEQQLDWLRFEVNELNRDTTNVYYELTNTIDLSAYDSDGIRENGNWTPIGGKKIFKGNFDGNGYAILNMVILDKESGFLGLFGHVSGHIFELGVVDYYIEGNTYLGGIAGRNYQGLISRSYSKGEIKGEARIGGIAGHNIGNATIMECYATVNLEGVDKIGGVVGYSYQDGNIVSSYATGSMDGKTMVGVILGGEAGSKVLNTYWDNEAVLSMSNKYGTGLTTSQMTGLNAIKHMEGFDFENTWQACEGDYPQLKVFATCQPASQPAENQEELTSVKEEKPRMEEEVEEETLIEEEERDEVDELTYPEGETTLEIDSVLVQTPLESEIIEEEEEIIVESERIDSTEEILLPIEENEDCFSEEVQEGDELSETINLKEGEEEVNLIEFEKTTEGTVVFLMREDRVRGRVST